MTGAVTFQVERMAQCVDEMGALLLAHWHEIAVDHEAVPLAPDFEAYRAMDAADALLIVTARKDQRLVGYQVWFVRPHPHYRSTLHAMSDIFYLAPAERLGNTGVRMFKESERALKARGVVKVIANTKVAHDVGVIFERLGWRETERVFTKVIGG